MAEWDNEFDLDFQKPKEENNYEECLSCQQ